MNLTHYGNTCDRLNNCLNHFRRCQTDDGGKVDKTTLTNFNLVVNINLELIRNLFEDCLIRAFFVRIISWANNIILIIVWSTLEPQIWHINILI